MGWSTYFVFILAAINTLTVTYFLAIDNYPALKDIFPSFEQYAVMMVCIGIPLLILVGYAHFKKTLAYKSEMDVMVESNPYLTRNTVNADLSLKLNLKLISLLLRMSNGEKIEKNEIDEIEKLHNEISKFVEKRNFKNNLKSA
jgi:amino acid permease